MVGKSGVSRKTNVKKKLTSNNLSAIGSRHAPKKVFSCNRRAKLPSRQSVMAALKKKINANPQQW